ncbi:MAG TPA: acyl-CoA dehydrogenase family protein [Acidimicrobiales bacterium]|nr:acyl-CoA dehydrogenase family protein [Acidimicrobiales bacterium]
MDLSDTPDEAAFRAECRAWLEASAEPRRLDAEYGVLSLFHSAGADMVAARAWQSRKADGGWAGLTWPVEYGGRGAPPIHQVIFNQEVADFDAPEVIFSIGVHMGGPTLIAHATTEQKDQWLRRLLRGDDIWCQLFSEPDAGSDLASLRTAAVRDGDVFVVNGQKVWSSGAHYADWGMLLARTDPDVPRHAGISWIALDMQSPGITVRPLKQMNGGAHFNEVFFEDVRVPVANVVGAINDGWSVASTTLLNERLMAGNLLGQDDMVASLIELARTTGATKSPTVRDALARIVEATHTLRYLNYRLVTAISRTGFPSPEAAVAKLATARLFADAADLALRIQGAAGTLGDGPWQLARLEAPALRLGGGTDEVLKNVIGERVLGLPREPRPS